MLMLVWFWAVTSAFAPAQQMMTMTANALEAQRETIEQTARPLMTLGWVDEDDAAIF